LLGGIEHMHRTALIAALFGMLFVAGCAHTIKFKAVDAATGQPLAGVVTSWRQDSYDLLLGRAYHYGPTNLTASAEDGIVVVGGIYKRKVSKFILSRNGYATVYGGYHVGGNFTRAEHTNSISTSTGFILKEPLISVPLTNGSIVVQMHPQ
jgi:hypothetical protein